MHKEKTILLVDDCQDDLLLMRSAFRKAAFHNPVQELHNGEAAIAYLKGDGRYSDRDKFPLPLVMILDLNMPMKNGFEVLSWLRDQPGLKRLAVIILSASKRVEDVERAFELGISLFLVKPISLEELISMSCLLRDLLRINHFPSLHETVKR